MPAMASKCCSLPRQARKSASHALHGQHMISSMSNVHYMLQCEKALNQRAQEAFLLHAASAQDPACFSGIMPNIVFPLLKAV